MLFGVLLSAVVAGCAGAGVSVQQGYPWLAGRGPECGRCKRPSDHGWIDERSVWHCNKCRAVYPGPVCHPMESPAARSREQAATGSAAAGGRLVRVDDQVVSVSRSSGAKQVTGAGAAGRAGAPPAVLGGAAVAAGAAKVGVGILKVAVGIGRVLAVVGGAIRFR
jgi:hypothetical protein